MTRPAQVSPGMRRVERPKVNVERMLRYVHLDDPDAFLESYCLHRFRMGPGHKPRTNRQRRAFVVEARRMSYLLATRPIPREVTR